ncbi:unnamed protein product [Clonostachys rosea]|uniref:Xylanolytic transcriptional activator regulatory domain-containing protein n=1 Tax=Bionectria ochroleuca TaxID=29856 RepID=A0ABY6UN62_BIOOC|nr:unnamed protein product [Clonostachys rosea]
MLTSPSQLTVEDISDETADTFPTTVNLGIQAHLEIDLDGSLIYYGATSIFRLEEEDRKQFPSQPRFLGGSQDAHRSGEASVSHVLEYFGINMDDDVVHEALTQFFRWQYPHFMFIYREAFLRDHCGNREHAKYWSPALLLSICALGALMSLEDRYRKMCDQFFFAAESIALVNGLAQPSIATVQTFLCLAFYEIGRGNLSKGWGFSGIAFRMAQDLGFQRDPQIWISHSPYQATREDVEIRRRIYWGCYISDKLISMVLGRPIQLPYNDAQVEPLTILPYAYNS